MHTITQLFYQHNALLAFVLATFGAAFGLYSGSGGWWVLVVAGICAYFKNVVYSIVLISLIVALYLNVHNVQGVDNEPDGEYKSGYTSHLSAEAERGQEGGETTPFWSALLGAENGLKAMLSTGNSGGPAWAGGVEKYLHTNTPYWVRGDVVARGKSTNSAWVMVENAVLYNPPAYPIEIKRLKLWTGEKKWPGIGDKISTQGVVYPDDPPLVEGGLDERKYNLNKGIDLTLGLRGELYTECEKCVFSPKVWFNKLREDIEKLITSSIADERKNGGIKAVLVGQRGGLFADDRQNFREAGIAHLIAISGLHIGMMIGAVFLLLNTLGVMTLPRLYASHNMRPAVGLLALGFGWFYVFMAGASLPTVRAGIMVTGLVLALLVGRKYHGLRFLALAALVILLIWPQAAIDPSFQFSFAASLAVLVWAKSQEKLPTQFWLMRLVDYIKSVFSVSFVAGLAVMPLTAVHFGTVTLAGVLANLLAIPVMAFWVLPVGFWGLGLKAVFGLDFGLQLAGEGFGVLNAIGAHFAQYKALQFTVFNGWQTAAITVFALGALVLFLSERKAYSFATVAALGGVLALWPVTTPFAIYNNGHLAVVDNSAGEGAQAVFGNPNGFQTFQLFNALHHPEWEQYKPLPQTCDAVGCTVEVGGQRLVVLNAPYTPTADDCTLADAVISPGGVWLNACHTRLPNTGTITLYADKGGAISYKHFVPTGLK